jgi:hypothetical protein
VEAIENLLLHNPTVIILAASAAVALLTYLLNRQKHLTDHSEAAARKMRRLLAQPIATSILRPDCPWPMWSPAADDHLTKILQLLLECERLARGLQINHLYAGLRDDELADIERLVKKCRPLIILVRQCPELPMPIVCWNGKRGHAFDYLIKLFDLTK